MNKFLPRCPAELNSKVVRKMGEDGANNHIIAKYFSTIANFACINLEHPSFQPMKEPQTPAEQLAARLVMDYLLKKEMKMSLEVVKNEAQNKGFSDKNKSNPKVLRFTRQYPPIKKLVRQRMCIPDEEGWYEIDSQNTQTIIGDEPIGTTFDAQTIIDKIERRAKAAEEENLVGYARPKSPILAKYLSKREPTNFSVKSKSLSNNRSGAASIISQMRSNQAQSVRGSVYNDQNKSYASRRRVFPN